MNWAFRNIQGEKANFEKIKIEREHDLTLKTYSADEKNYLKKQVERLTKLINDYSEVNEILEQLFIWYNLNIKD